MDSELHVIFGAGQIGTQVASELVLRGKRVRLVRRGEPGPTSAGISWMQGDVCDPVFARRAVQDAAVVYNCVNPQSYGSWARTLLPLFGAVQRAATDAGARLVVLDNLYMYGPTAEPLRETTPMRPSALKSALRARLSTELFEAHAKGELIATSGRASDYFGPGTTRMSLLGRDAIAKIAAGRTLDVVGDPDLPHAFSYAPDVARGLAILGTSEEAWGRPWHLPVTWHGSVRQIADRFARELGHGKAKLRAAPDWLVRVAGAFSSDLNGLVEMLYQWKAPFLVDDSEFRAAFGVEATPIDEAVRASVGTQALARAA